MKTLFIVHIPSNESSVKQFREDPKGVADRMESMVKQVKAEAAYFGEDRGERTAYIVVDLPSADTIPSVAEPFFVNLGARVQ